MKSMQCVPLFSSYNGSIYVLLELLSSLFNLHNINLASFSKLGNFQGFWSGTGTLKISSLVSNNS